MWLTTILQGGVQSGKLNCYTARGDKLSCVLADLTAAAGGEAGFGLIICGLILVGTYMAGNGGFATPAVLMILFGGVLIPLLPGGMQTVAGTIILLGLATAVFAVLQKYVLSPGV